MVISLSSQTQKLLEEQMLRSGEQSADDMVRIALETLKDMETGEIDEDTLTAIEEGLAQANRGEGRPWEEVREELRKKYIAE